MTSASLLGMDSTSDLKYSESTILSLYQCFGSISFWCRSGSTDPLLGWWIQIRPPRSGEFPGYVMTVICSLSRNHLVTILALWQGVDSCKNGCSRASPMTPLQLVLKQPQVSHTSHHLTFTHKLNPSRLPKAEAPPHHHLGWVLYCPLGEEGIKPVQPRLPPAERTLAAKPEFKMTCPQTWFFSCTPQQRPSSGWGWAFWVTSWWWARGCGSSATEWYGCPRPPPLGSSFSAAWQ